MDTGGFVKIRLHVTDAAASDARVAVSELSAGESEPALRVTSVPGAPAEARDRRLRSKKEDVGLDCSSTSPESSRLSFTQNRGDVGLETEKVDGTSAPISLWEASPRVPGCPRATLGPGRKLCTHT